MDGHQEENNMQVRIWIQEFGPIWILILFRIRIQGYTVYVTKIRGCIFCKLRPSPPSQCTFLYCTSFERCVSQEKLLKILDQSDKK